MLKRTKIVATLGPATDNPDVMDGLIQAGVDLVRINLSHDAHDAHYQRIAMVRERARMAGREIGILADLSGIKRIKKPKSLIRFHRICTFKTGILRF